MKAQASAKPAPVEFNYMQMANAIRALSMDAVEKANSGHPGMPMGMADVAAVLFGRFLKFNPADPTWPDRDRFILSAGHGSMLLYSVLHLTGYEKMTLDDLKNFRQLGSHTAGHPETDHERGIETTTGPLGQGISNAVGFALAERILNAKFTDELVDHHTYVIASDGDLMEGISHEACALAGHLKLSQLIVLYDDNGISIDGPTSLSYSDDVTKRFEAYGWHVLSADAHNTAEIEQAIRGALVSDKPTLIRCKSFIGYGAPTKQGMNTSHGSPLGAQEILGVRDFLKWPHEAFVIPEDVAAMWQAAGRRSLGEYNAWQARLNQNRYKDQFESWLSCDVSKSVDQAIAEAKADFTTNKPKLATRASSGKVLERLVPALPCLIGGSADLTGSNLTKVKGPEAISAGNYNGQYIYYGVREHGMAAIMNGMTLHGGIIPYGGTFLSFSDYCRPSIRLSALMKQRVVYVMTHDSIGLGEDGPTHQPVEHLAALRAIPNCMVMRPCDAVETAECWQVALNTKDAPSILSLTRQNLPTLRTEGSAENWVAKGAYVLAEASAAPRVIIIATGSEVEIAMNAREQLEKLNIPTRVVSAPCLELFAKQDKAYQDSILPPGPCRVAIEAALRFGWDRWIGNDGIFIGMTGFGESAPAEQLYKHFGITADAVVEAVRKKV